MTTALVLCRFAHFLSAMLTFGASAYLWLYAPPRLMVALSPAIRRLAFVGSVTALITAILWLALEAAAMAEDWSAAVDPGAITAVLADTAFGHAWAAHLALAAMLVLIAGFGPREAWAPTAVTSGAALASLGFVGHAAMQTGVEGLLHRLNHAVHLLATGAWLGGLIPFVMCLAAYHDPILRREAVRAMAGFSFWGHFIVAAIIVTGVVNIALTSGRPPIPPETAYGALLDAKIALVAIMIALALFNRYALVPRLKASAPAVVGLRATSVAEVALGVAVVALVSAFALLDPA